jgi:hypothetical protein
MRVLAPLTTPLALGRVRNEHLSLGEDKIVANRIVVTVIFVALTASTTAKGETGNATVKKPANISMAQANLPAEMAQAETKAEKCRRENSCLVSTPSPCMWKNCSHVLGK